MQFFNFVTMFALVAVSTAAYTGPCSANDCGAAGEVCGAGILCVPYPTFDPASREGCTCSGKQIFLLIRCCLAFADVAPKYRSLDPGTTFINQAGLSNFSSAALWHRVDMTVWDFVREFRNALRKFVQTITQIPNHSHISVYPQWP